MYKTGDLARRRRGIPLHGPPGRSGENLGNRWSCMRWNRPFWRAVRCGDVTLLMQKGKETAGLAAYVIPSDDYSEERLKGYMEERLPAYIFRVFSSL